MIEAPPAITLCVAKGRQHVTCQYCGHADNVQGSQVPGMCVPCVRCQFTDLRSLQCLAAASLVSA